MPTESAIRSRFFFFLQANPIFMSNPGLKMLINMHALAEPFHSFIYFRKERVVYTHSWDRIDSKRTLEVLQMTSYEYINMRMITEKVAKH